MSQQRHAWRSCQRKHRKPIFKESTVKLKTILEKKNKKIVLKKQKQKKKEHRKIN